MLAAGIALIASLFAAFGGVLTNIAPPEIVGEQSTTPAAVGLASFVALIALLLTHHVVSLIGVARRAVVAWLTIAAMAGLIFAITTVRYQGAFEINTFPYTTRSGDRVTMVKGTEPTDAAKVYVDKNGDLGPSDLVRATEMEDPTEVWTKESIIRVRASMLRQYQLLVVSLCVGLFALLSLGLRRVKDSPDEVP